ncbi:hypothetical protein C8J57DRAFT_1081520, partial [Mycena rebaudengoi]
TGSVALKALVLGRGRPHFLKDNDSAYLLRLAKHQPSTFLEEYQKFLITHRYLPTCISPVHRTFERAGLVFSHYLPFSHQLELSGRRTDSLYSATWWR